MWAHSLNAAGVRHALADHLYGTAELAGGFAAAFGVRDAGYFLGLAHDAGKASCCWQEGLARAEQTGGRVGLDHKTLGVYLAARRGLGIAQFALHGHHGGLTCRDHIGRTMRQERADGGGRRRGEARPRCAWSCRSCSIARQCRCRPGWTSRLPGSSWSGSCSRAWWMPMRWIRRRIALA
jgi:CRISPR-associated endonuclease/helicase Cas3